MRKIKRNKALFLFTCLLFLLLMVWVLPDRAFPQEGEIKIPETILVESGSFWMGMNVSMDTLTGATIDGVTGATPLKESPAHQVTMSSFYIGKYEVTNEEYAEFVDAGGYDEKEYWLIDQEDHEREKIGWNWKERERRTAPRYLDFSSGEMSGWDLTKDPYWKDDLYSNQATTPVIGVSWHEVYAYCKWLSSVTGDNYRLPTEAEWEYAARGTESFIFPWGDEYLSAEEMCGEPGSGAMANCLAEGNGVNKATPVGSYPEGISPCGAYDMAGNVAEWTKDWCQILYYPRRIFLGLTEDPPGPSIVLPPFLVPIPPFWLQPCRAVRSTSFSQDATENSNFNPSGFTYPLRSSYKMFMARYGGFFLVGFRVLKKVE